MNVIVVGSGLAGLTAALHAIDAGHRTTLITKDALGSGCTALAQGGVAGVYGDGDSPALHASDTLAAGAGLSDAAAVDVLVQDGSARIAELIAHGVAFDRDADGMLLLGREAAHTHARIVHAGGDATGAAISRALVSHVRSSSIEVIERAMLVDLLAHDGAVRGVSILRGDACTEIHADAVILATGGAGQLFAHTTNPVGATGDGIAAALRAGAAVADLEFVQFHPTVLDAGEPFLISEAVRGEDATLIDDEGRRFVFDAHPDGELAPRDVVARAVARQAASQGSPVRLDATMIGASRLAERFPTIDRVTRERGFDWSREPIPVTPAAHYLMGGVVTDLDGRTSVPGLFAAGEVARTGVHGANRLASNSLLEAAVFGARAADAVTSSLFRSRIMPVSAVLSGGIRDLNVVGFSRSALQDLMWDHVGLLRTRTGIAEALETIRAWRAAAPAPTTRTEHEDADLLLVAEAMASAALARTESVGAHHLELEPALIGA
ncbi:MULTISPECIES: L-aspartate oxidase [unclassified Microbacterium]|uniref:L-aspartate oxidase n=1 Tax=unclassified Microbacterium TaxID=2609290 RepID=UPI001D2BEBB0|nr:MULTISPECIES: L-aspartate oxidase [unclassified Microbacterium]CAH0130178.1 L-aspartate oxidase [Microbacterium sp. Bi121]HWK77153.1 L-aspartate oxidase [Microbacterium sp.]